MSFDHLFEGLEMDRHAFFRHAGSGGWIVERRIYTIIIMLLLLHEIVDTTIELASNLDQQLLSQAP